MRKLLRGSLNLNHIKKVVCKDNHFHVKNIKDKNKVRYETLYQALNDGCRKCKHCFKEQ